MKNRIFVCLLTLAFFSGCVGANSGGPTTTPDRTTALSERAKAVLIRALHDEKGLVQVHAADALIAFGEFEMVRQVYAAQVPIDPASPYRVGAWRSLAGAARSPQDRAVWVGKIEAEFLDLNGNLRVGAIESLCKIRHVVTGKTLEAARAMAATGSESDAIFALWALHLAGDRTAIPRIAQALDSSVSAARLRAAYVIRWEGTADAAVLQRLARAAAAERPEMPGYTHVVGAAFALNADPARCAAWQAQLEEVLATGLGAARSDVCQSLMRRYRKEDLSKVEPLLEHPDAEARMGAARAILQVLR